MIDFARREFLRDTATLGTALATLGTANSWAQQPARPQKNAASPAYSMGFGLVTYMWGARWDLPTLLKNCETARAQSVELRTTHRHGVEPKLNKQQRKDVAKRFADSPVTLAGLGSNNRFDSPDAKTLAQNIEEVKAFIRLSHDVGGSGVKVKPNDLPKGVPVERTIEQIGKSLNELALYGEGFGQQIRLEVHGGCARLPIMKQIMDVATENNATICWNSNQQDLQGKGLAGNFDLVKDRLGATVHVRELDSKNYPYAQLIGLLKKMKYQGWLLLETSSKPKDSVAELGKQVKLFHKLAASG